jgi:citrate/tricarballylate utilization protein
VLSPELIIEADRQLTICNACRYCEEFCAVFPAIELRTDFNGDDVLYLANLCHDCRECYYACQYAPPHEFAVNIPQVLTQVRHETYRTYSWPGFLGKVGQLGTWATVGLAAGLAAVFLLLTGITGFSELGHGHSGPGAFYAVIPWLAMLIPALALGIFAVAALVIGAVKFMIATGPSPRDLVPTRAAVGALADAMSLRYMRGPDSAGCSYPADKPSQARVVFHSLVAYGFLTDFASTGAAAIWQDFLGVRPPYPILSVPVILGIVGGAAILVGVAGLLGLRRRSDAAPSAAAMTALDRAFLVLLGLVCASGLLLMALRSTPALAVLLDVHLGTVAALFLTMPYGKFAHGIYRYAALVRYRLEMRHAGHPANTDAADHDATNVTTTAGLPEGGTA